MVHGPIYGTHKCNFKWFYGISNDIYYGLLNYFVRPEGTPGFTNGSYGVKTEFAAGKETIYGGGSNNRYGMSNSISNGILQIGTENFLTSGSTSYGTHNSIASFSDFGFGSYTRIDMLAGEAYGTKNVFIGSSTGAKYGTYDSVGNHK